VTPARSTTAKAATTKASAPDKLEPYRRKRDATVTPEPVPARTPRQRESPGPQPPRFVIQEHHARALHWDFRLERDGVLVSWAIPKGLPIDKKTNHLAVHTEDHPLEYATFEGTIPGGEYGGGQVILWDVGTYDEIKWSDAEVMVVLHGEKVQGQYVLFATNTSRRKSSGPPKAGTKKSPPSDIGPEGYRRNWMVHRMDDAPDGYEPPPTDIEPMLATLGTLPRDDGAWAFEFKWDGIRAIGHIDGGRIRITSRNGNDLTASFPELRALGEYFGSRQAVIDGEIVAFDDQGRPRFQKLQPRIHASDPAKARRLADEQPAVYVLFDLLYLDGHMLTKEPYRERRRRLEALGLDAKGASWTLSPRFDGPGADILRASQDQGLEGVLAKRLDSPYLPGKRSPTWTKVKNILMQEVVIGGWTPGEGHRQGRFGSLLLGIPDAEGLRYVGQVGTGFSEAVLDDLMQKLAARRTSERPFATDIPRRYDKGATWVEPTLVGEVSFSEWTTEGRMRHPAWRGLRDDKSPAEVHRES
jgi:bifunctional non-homologous end joining protein LigD